MTTISLNRLRQRRVTWSRKSTSRTTESHRREKDTLCCPSTRSVGQRKPYLAEERSNFPDKKFGHTLALWTRILRYMLEMPERDREKDPYPGSFFSNRERCRVNSFGAQWRLSAVSANDQDESPRSRCRILRDL